MVPRYGIYTQGVQVESPRLPENPDPKLWHNDMTL
jgi:hypothetical protein